MFELHERGHSREHHFNRTHAGGHGLHGRGPEGLEHTAERDTENCPLCAKHCSLGEPACGRGSASKQGEMNMENEEPGSSRHIMGLLQHVFRRMARGRHEMGHSHHAQSRVLAILAEKTPMSQRDLLEELDIRSSSLSELLAKLERASYIARERDEADRRNFVVKLTDEGRNTLESNDRRQGMDAMLDNFSEEERKIFAGLLQKLNDSLEKFYPGADEVPRGQHHGHQHGGEHGFRRGRHGRGPHCED